MKKYLLDSDIIIGFFKNQPKAISTIEKIQNHQLFISIINWCEIKYGIQKIQSKKKQQQFAEFIQLLNIKTLNFDKQAAQIYLNLKLDLEKEGKKLADFDLIIASTAISKQLILISNNKKHFSRIKELTVE